VNCDLYTIIPQAMTEARKIGGNALKITQHIPNSNGCHQITASILKLDYPEDYQIETISEDANYALLHLFRPNGAGHAITYDLFLDTMLIARSENNWRETVKVETEGQYTLSGRTQQTIRLPLNIKFGNEYYVRSWIIPGFLMGNPMLLLMDNSFGRLEFQSITTKTNYSIAGDTLNPLTKSTFPRFRFSANIGFGYRTASPHEDLDVYQKDFYNKSRSGLQFDLGATYFFSEWIGVGLKYSDFFASHSDDGWEFTPPSYLGGGPTQYGRLSTKARTTFIGPTFSYRLFDKQKKNCFVTDFGIGWMGFQQEMGITSHVMTNATTAGVYWRLGYDVWMSAKTSLGFQFAFVGGSFSRFTQTYQGFKQNIKLDEGSEDIGRIELSVGLRF
jgi:hypothetical protein